MEDAVIKYHVICQECKYARRNLGFLAASCKAAKHGLVKYHAIDVLATSNGKTVSTSHHIPPKRHNGEDPPF